MLELGTFIAKKYVVSYYHYSECGGGIQNIPD
jgi:hypothetical protein